MSAGAERQARRVLRAYPKAWRDAHGEALVGTLLDTVEGAGRNRLTWAEIADVLGQGLLQRARKAVATSAGRLLGAAGLAVGGALALAGLILGELAPRYADNAAWLGAEQARQQAAGLTAAFGPFPTTGPVLYLAWAGLVLAAMFGEVRLIRRLAVSAAVLAAVLLFSGTVGLTRPPLTIVLALGWSAGLVALAPWRIRTAVAAAVAALAGTALLVAGMLPAVLWPRGTDQVSANAWYRSFNRVTHGGSVGLGGPAMLAPALVALTLLAVLLALGLRALNSTDGRQTDPSGPAG